jgi:hypothetical protein
VRALDSQTLSTTATCFQRHIDGRRAGLKIRSPQEGVGSRVRFAPVAPRPASPPSRPLVQVETHAGGRFNDCQRKLSCPKCLRAHIKRMGKGVFMQS